MDQAVWRTVSHTVLVILSILCILPFILLFTSSIAEETTIIRDGYTFFPKDISFDAYDYLIQNSKMIVRSYGVTIFVTVVGTTLSLLLMSMLAYPLSRRDLPLGKVFAFFVFFTVLFNGGLVPTYLMYTQLFGIKNTIFALIIPNLLMNGFYVFIMRTFFATTIPIDIVESASLDGAGEFRVFTSIIMPLSLPILATMGLFQTVNYWNDWFNGLIYLTDPKLFSLQNVLNQIITNVEFLAQDTNSRRTFAQLPTLTIRMAIAFIGIVPVLAAYPFFQRYLVRGIVIGAVK